MTAVLPAGPRVLADLPVEIDPADVLRFQGYRPGAPAPSAAVRALLAEALAEGRRLLAPRAVVAWWPVRRRDGDTLVTPAGDLTVPGVGRAWGPVEHVAAGVATVGPALEARVAALWAARELPLAAMLDSVGSAAVERLVEAVNDALCAEGLAAGLRVTNHLAPGYGAWDVADQPRLFALVPGERVGVTLNAACFMTPTKSQSLLVGAGAAARVDHAFTQCARCWMRDCAYRRAPARAVPR